MAEEEDVQMAAAEVAPTAAAVGNGANGTNDASDDEAALKKAKRQFEFYFADSNLPYDRFMWTLHAKTPEHWVPIETIASFKRMREFKDNGIPWLVRALKSSEDLEVDETETKVKRKFEVKEPKGQMERSVYAKGFPDEDPTLQTRLEDFFNNYGSTNQVRMRRDDNKKFKNSIFAEFCDDKTVEAFLNADLKPSFEGRELLIMSKEKYCEMKIKEKGLTGKSANLKKDALNGGRGFNAFREMEKSTSKPAENVVHLHFMGTNIPIDGSDGIGRVKEEEVPFVKGSTLKFSGCGGKVVYSEIKDPLKDKFENPTYIKYSEGDNDGLLGFYHILTPEQIQLVKGTLPTINGNSVTWSLPEEDEERAFQLERAQGAAKTIWERSTTRGGRGGRGRGRGRGGSSGRGRGGGRGGNKNAGAKADRASNKYTTNVSAKEAKEPDEAQIGEKRKRAVEPDGGPDVGTRGNNAPPVIQSAKKAKADGES